MMSMPVTSSCISISQLVASFSEVPWWVSKIVSEVEECIRIRSREINIADLYMGLRMKKKKTNI